MPTYVPRRIGFPISVIAIAVFMPLLISSSACQIGTGGVQISPFVTTGAAPSPTPDPSTITVAAVGDIMLGSPFPNDTRMPPNDGADLLKDVTPILSAADIAFGNLEGPITDNGLSGKCKPPKPPEPGKDQNRYGAMPSACRRATPNT